MPKQLIPPEPWWPDAADLMARYDLSLRQAAAELGTDLTIEQADAIFKRKLFQKALEEARIAYHTELGSNPKLTKEAVVGQIFKLAMSLAEDREDYKAADTLQKMAKIKGWMYGEGERPDVLSTLNQFEIDSLKQRIRELRAAAELSPEGAEKSKEPDSEPAKLAN